MQKLKIEYPHGGAVARITLNSPKGNVLDLAMMKELQELFAEFKSQSDLKLITFEGEGNHFSFGASVDEHRKEQAAEMISNFHRLFYELMELSVPTLAKVRGQCLGGAMELCLMCNFIFADKTAKFGQPEIVLGVFPPPASLLLPMKIGSARAEELLITGKSISADDAKESGFVYKVFEDEPALNAGVDKIIIDSILPKSASSLRIAVKAARKIFSRELADGLKELEQMYVYELMETYDANEGINSFLEKRKPEWQNK